MKKNVLTALALIMMLSLSSCGVPAVKPGNGEGTVSTQAQWLGWDLAQFIDNSEYVFRGKCLKKSVCKNGNAELCFDIHTVLKGNYDSSVGTFISADPEWFKEGEDYLILCGREASVFWQKDFYGISTVIYTEDNEIKHEGISDLHLDIIEDIADFITAYCKTVPGNSPEAITGDYCRSGKLTDIYDYSSDVFVVEVERVIFNAVDDRTTYLFKVENTIKGGFSGEGCVIAFKDSMNVGEKYLLMVSKLDDNVFTVCSLNSVQIYDGGAMAIK